MGNADKLNNVTVDLSCELGRKEMTLKEVRQLEVQDVVELGRLAGEAFEIRMNGKLFGFGEVVVVADLMAVRLTGLVELPQEAGS